MEQIRNMGLKKSFFAIITISLVIAILLSVLFYGLCQMAIEHFELSVVLSVDNNTEVQSDNSAIVITGQGEAAAKQYYSYYVQPGYSIIMFLQMAMPVVFVVVALIYADIVFYRVKLKRPIQILRESAERIEHYIEIMTNAQKLEELECNKQICNKNSLQSELKNSLSILAEMSGKELKISCSGTIEQVMLDKQFVFNIAENLISNALRYADKYVSVDVCYQKNQMTLCVTDDGKGYSDTLLKKGITPFLKSEEADSGHFGMGLYLCKLLCEKHGGSLTIQNLTHGAKATSIFQF